MNVRELIEELSKLPPDLPAYYKDVDYGLIEVEATSAVLANVDAGYVITNNSSRVVGTPIVLID